MATGDTTTSIGIPGPALLLGGVLLVIAFAVGALWLSWSPEASRPDEHSLARQIELRQKSRAALD